MKAGLALIAACLAASAARADIVPDPPFIGGAINPSVTQENIQSTICVRGWTQSIRPPQDYTANIKAQMLEWYRLKPDAGRHYELDHLIPLALGGHPTDPRNLWLQAWGGARGAKAKDELEAAVAKDVCDGRLTLRQGQSIFVGDWYAEHVRRFGQ